MKLDKLIDIHRLGQLIDDGYVTARKHPKHPLVILNYSPASQGLKAEEWDDTLSMCRGLVYDEQTLDVVAIPFRKFWNYGDERHPETINLPKGSPTIYEKMDGSFLIGFFYKDEFIVATRGSFESDQAKRATDWVKTHLNPDNINVFARAYNYMFEVIIPEDKKVVDYYGYMGLVLLGGADPTTGRECSLKTARDSCTFLRGLRLPRTFDGHDIEALSKLDTDNEEGFVVTWHNSVGRTVRVKIKFETYKKLHRMYFQTTPEVIWELVKDGKDVKGYLVGADQALTEWAAELANKLQLDFHATDCGASFQFESINDEVKPWGDCYDERLSKETRKQFALRAVKSPYKDLLFLLLDGKIKEYKEAIWKRIKPTNAKPLRIEEE